jgi:hypothetical protein
MQAASRPAACSKRLRQSHADHVSRCTGRPDDEAYDLYYKLQKDKRLASVFADGDWNTVMYLPARFEANLIPRYARDTFDISEGMYVRRGRRRKNGRRYRKPICENQILANRRISETVAEASEPDAFLENLRIALRGPKT